MSRPYGPLQRIFGGWSPKTFASDNDGADSDVVPVLHMSKYGEGILATEVIID